MKKIKRILAVLSSVMVMSTCAVSAVYADEALTELTENVSDENSLELAENPIQVLSLTKGDINIDGTLDVRDCAFIASKLAKGEEFSDIADYNADGKVNVRDAATIAKDLANKIK